MRHSMMLSWLILSALGAAGCMSAGQEGDVAESVDTNSASLSGPSEAVRRVHPVVRCVELQDNGGFVAHFGVSNENPSAVSIPIGCYNFFSPGRGGRGQPTVFAPNLTEDVVQVPVAPGEASIGWWLGTHLATAWADYPRCTANGGVVGSLPQDDVVLDGLVSASPIDEPTGSVVHSTVGNGTGQISGGVTRGPGRIHGGLSFDGTGGSLNLGNGASLNFGTGPFSLETWFKTPAIPSSTTPARTLMAKRDSFSLFMHPAGGSIHFRIHKGSPQEVSSTPVVRGRWDDNQWHHAVLTVEGSGLARGYVDGVGMDQAVVPPSGTWTTPHDLLVGADESTPSANWVGQLDEPRVYNRVLTEGEVLSNYAQAFPALSETGPSSQWNFDETGGTIASDSGPAGNTCTIQGGVTFVPGHLGNAIELNGTDGWLDCGNSPSLHPGKGSFTIETWFRTPPMVLGESPLRTLVAKAFPVESAPGFALYFHPANALLYLYYRNGAQGFNRQFVPSDGSQPQRYDDNQWHHLVLSLDRTNSRVDAYVDGSSVGTRSLAGIDASMDSPAPFVIGKMPHLWGPASGAPLHFQGTLDGMRFYHRALTATEALAAYQQL